MVIGLVESKDIDDCIDFVEIVKGDFVGYKREEFLKALEKCIENKEALIAAEDSVVGLLLFSKEDKELQFLATHPDHRKKGIAKRLIRKMEASFEAGERIHVVTFRDDDEKGVAARGCYHSCGFIDDELVTVFEYPCQRMVLVVGEVCIRGISGESKRYMKNC